MAAVNGDAKDLAAQVKAKCRITWDDQDTDSRIEEELVPSGCAAIRFLVGIPDGEGFDFAAPGVEHMLLMAWCYYAWHDAEDDFQQNYAAEIAQARRRWEVACAQREEGAADLS